MSDPVADRARVPGKAESVHGEVVLIVPIRSHLNGQGKYETTFVRVPRIFALLLLALLPAGCSSPVVVQPDSDKQTDDGLGAKELAEKYLRAVTKRDGKALESLFQPIPAEKTPVTEARQLHLKLHAAFMGVAPIREVRVVPLINADAQRIRFPSRESSGYRIVEFQPRPKARFQLVAGEGGGGGLALAPALLLDLKDRFFVGSEGGRWYVCVPVFVQPHSAAEIVQRVVESTRQQDRAILDADLAQFADLRARANALVLEMDCICESAAIQLELRGDPRKLVALARQGAARSVLPRGG